MKKNFLLLVFSALLFTACSNDKKDDKEDDDKMTNTMEDKEERNKKVVMASMEAFNKGDLDGVFKDAASGFTDYTDGSMPPMNNVDSIKAFIKVMTSSIPDYKGENLMYFADGDKVLVVGDWSGTFKSDLMGMKATGKTFKFKDVDIFTLNDEGKITEHRSVANMGAAIMASGNQ